MPKKVKVHAALIIAGLIYGANYVVAKSVMPDYLTPFAFLLFRVFFAAILFWVFHALFIQEKVKEASDYRRFLTVAIFGVGANMLAFFKGLNYTSAVNASVIMTLVPIIVLVASYLLLKEPITRLKVLGILCGTLGAVLLITSKGVSLQNTGFVGDLLIMINGIFYGIYLVIVKPLMLKYHPATIIKWAFTFGFFLVLPFGAMETLNASWSTIPSHIWMSISYVVGATTFGTYLLTAWALQHVNSTTASAYIYIQPVFATFIAVLFTGEILTISKLSYAFLIFIGVFLVSKS